VPGPDDGSRQLETMYLGVERMVNVVNLPSIETTPQYTIDECGLSFGDEQEPPPTTT
jgi:hypothetical protein